MSYDCYCDYDPPEFYCLEIRKARKQRGCDECAGPILPGDRYEHVRGKWDGWISSWDTCESCLDLRIWTKNNVPCLCWAHGSLIEDCRTAVDEAVYRAGDEARGLRFGLLRRIVAADKRRIQRRNLPHKEGQ